MFMASEPALQPRDLLLCFSHLRWNFVLQRPQHLLMRAARDFGVIFVEEPEFVDGAAPDLRLQWHGDVLVATPVMAPDQSDAAAHIKKHVERLIVPLRVGRVVHWYYTPMALPIARDLPADCIVYDCMDELSAFKNAPARLRHLERELLGSCDLLFTGGESLHEAKRGRHADAHCFPSSIDTAHFVQARAPRADPTDQESIPHPRIGFFGVIDERFDIPLLNALAAHKPDWHFVMIGPVVKIDPAELPQAPNIHWLGRKEYSQLPDYLRGWDAGFMPFAINDSTQFISPTKTPEFLAAGLPVVSTPIRDVVRTYGATGLVKIAGGPLDMAAALEEVLLDPEPGWLAAVDQQLSGSSWDQTWQDMHALIERALSLPQSPVTATSEVTATSKRERSLHV
ncbi:MAG: glycosyl transferase [Hyphomicrobiales bacterium]|nr:MAG: glycosyl transferase [Hyphomicrobiales bacterium]